MWRSKIEDPTKIHIDVHGACHGVCRVAIEDPTKIQQRSTASEVRQPQDVLLVAIEDPTKIHVIHHYGDQGDGKVAIEDPTKIHLNGITVFGLKGAIEDRRAKIHDVLKSSCSGRARRGNRRPTPIRNTAAGT